jgi:hypothetical protein
MGAERPNSSNFEIKTVTPAEFINIHPPPAELQKLVYSRYTVHGNPQSVIPEVSSALSVQYEQSEKNVAYIIARGNAESMFQAPSSENRHLRRIEPDLRLFKELAGFLKVEWGMHKPDKPLPNLPIEAMVLTKGHPWPAGTTVGYAGSFTINPLLPRDTRIGIQINMHKALYALAAEQGFIDQIYAILAPHVASFVEDSGLTAIKISSQNGLNHEDGYAHSVFTIFPKYWVGNPKIYRFVPK